MDLIHTLHKGGTVCANQEDIQCTRIVGVTDTAVHQGQMTQILFAVTLCP
jgi:hypothetical protein